MSKHLCQELVNIYLPDRLYIWMHRKHLLQRVTTTFQKHKPHTVLVSLLHYHDNPAKIYLKKKIKDERKKIQHVSHKQKKNIYLIVGISKTREEKKQKEEEGKKKYFHGPKGKICMMGCHLQVRKIQSHNPHNQSHHFQICQLHIQHTKSLESSQHLHKVNIQFLDFHDNLISYWNKIQLHNPCTTLLLLKTRTFLRHNSCMMPV
jgi:hypothetical protein